MKTVELPVVSDGTFFTSAPRCPSGAAGNSLTAPEPHVCSSEEVFIQPNWNTVASKTDSESFDVDEYVHYFNRGT